MNFTESEQEHKGPLHSFPKKKKNLLCLLKTTKNKFLQSDSLLRFIREPSQLFRVARGERGTERLLDRKE